MSVRDIPSNFKPTPIDLDLTLTTSSTTKTAAIDLSAGLTTTVTYAVLANINPGLDFVIEYSVDSAFTNPVVDPGDLGNRITDDAGVDYVSSTVDETIVNMNIVNPPSVINSGDLTPIKLDGTVYRFARLSITTLGTVSFMSVSSIQKTGPQRFVAAK